MNGVEVLRRILALHAATPGHHRDGTRSSGVRFGRRSSTGKTAPAPCQRPSLRRASGGVP